MNNKIKAVEYNPHEDEPFDWDNPPDLSTRYMIVDAETGEVLDDAQGYGYTSARAAYSSWNYKLNYLHNSERKSQIDAASKWLQEHPDFADNLIDGMFIAAKSGETVRTKDVTQLLRQSGFTDLPFSTSILLKALKKY